MQLPRILNRATSCWAHTLLIYVHSWSVRFVIQVIKKMSTYCGSGRYLKTMLPISGGKTEQQHISESWFNDAEVYKKQISVQIVALQIGAFLPLWHCKVRHLLCTEWKYVRIQSLGRYWPSFLALLWASSPSLWRKGFSSVRRIFTSSTLILTILALM